MDTTLQSTLDNLTFDQARQNLTAAGYPTLTETARRAGSTSAPETTPSIDASNIGSPQAQPLDASPFELADTSGQIEDQIRAASAYFATNQQIRESENLIAALGDEIVDVNLEMGDLPGERADLEKEAGLPGLISQRNDVFAQAQKLQASLAMKLSEEGARTASGMFKIGRQAFFRQQAAAELSGLAAISSALEGQIATAQEYVNQQVNIKYSALEGQLNALNTALDLNKDRMTRQEARLAEKRQTEISLMMNRLQEQKQYERDANQSIVTAMTNGLGTQTGSRLMSQLARGEIDPATVFATTGAYLRDPLDRAIKNLTYKKALAEYNSIVEVENSEWARVIRTTASLVGAEKGKTTRTEMTKAIADGDYNTAFSYVVNNVEEKLTGENATKFGNQVTDYSVLQGLRSSIKAYEEAGGDLGLLKGKAEDISNSLLGVTGDPELTRVATQLNREFQAYRTAMTGAAFSPEESREYAKVNPRTTATLELNEAIIKGALDQLDNRISSTIESRVPGSTDLWDVARGNTETDYLDTVDTAIQTGGLGDDLDALLGELGIN